MGLCLDGQPSVVRIHRVAAFQWECDLPLASQHPCGKTAFRDLKGKLGRCWECLQSWQLKLPLKSCRPIPEELVNGMFLMGVAQGVLAGPRALDFWSAAMLVRVGFHCLFRPGEICKLIVGNLHFPRTSWNTQMCVVRLRDPKNRTSLGRFQCSLSREVSIVRWLRWYTEGCDAHTKLWPSSITKFSKVFKPLLGFLGLERLALTTASLRPGGATKAFVEGMSISNLKYLGRWRVEHSLETYIQEAMCQLMSSSLTDCEQSALHTLLSSCSDQLDSPPSRHWSVFCSRAAQWRGHQAQVARTRQRLQLSSCKTTKPMRTWESCIRRTPLATFALWDTERLKKLGRMKAEPNYPKGIVRGFAKLVLALRELSDTANGQDVPSAVSSSIPAAATSVYLPPLHAGALEPLQLAPVAELHSGKGSRAAPAKSAEHKQGCRDIFLDSESPSLAWPGWPFARPRSACQSTRAFPTALVPMLRTWRNVGTFFTHLVVVLFTWIPVSLFAFMVVTLLADPLLFGSLVWELLQWPTRSMHQH